MDMSETLTGLLMNVAHQPYLLVPLIIAATFVLEDIATITVALLASHMVIDPQIAVTALVAGTVLGDIAVFTIARRSAHIPFIARVLRTAGFRSALSWLQLHAVPALLVARFTPGLRLPIFAAAGSSNVSTSLFATVIGLSTLIWTPGLFYLASAAGMAGLDSFGGYAWLAPACLILFFVLLSRVVPMIVNRGSVPVALAA